MNDIIITTNNLKKEIIKNIRTINPFKKVKFYTLDEFLNSYPYIYNEKTLEYIMSKYNVILEVAKIYLENILKYDIEKNKSSQCLFLTELKQTLLKENLLQKNDAFLKYLKKCNITLIGIAKEKYLVERLKELKNVTWKTIEQKNYFPIVYELNTIEEEIAFVGEQIIKQLQAGTPIENIYLANIESDYEIPLKRIFKQLHIPIRLKTKTTLNQTTIGSKFVENWNESVEETLEIIKPFIHTEEEINIENQIIEICNKYLNIEKKKDFIFYDLKHTLVKINKTEKAIKEINLLEESFNENDFVFILSFNKEIPRTYKDEEFLSDHIREQLNIDTSKDRNIIEKDKVINAISNIKNCIITYKKNTLKKECYPSSLIEDLKLEVKKGHITYTVSDTYNKYILATLLDNYQKFGTISPLLSRIYHQYEINYHTYQNQFQKIPKEKIWKKMKHELHLSYTKLDTYHKCPFAYYILNVLKIVPYKDSFQIEIGNIFHKILEQIDNTDFDCQTAFDEEIQSRAFKEKELFLLKNLKEEFLFIIKTILEKRKFTSLTSSLEEYEINIPLSNEIPTTFQGKIDKILYQKEKNNQIYIMIDYKTGNTNIDESIMPLGFSMQLPTYLYLLKQDEFLKSGIVGGFYLQPILLNKLKREKKENYEITKQKALKLIGFSNKDHSILEKIDSSFLDSNLIKGLKVKQNGDFYNYSKVLDEDDFKTLYNLVETTIEKDKKGITNGEFPIAPKIIDGKNISCEFCPLKDICYHEPKDNIYLKSDKTFLKKEESHGLDERAITSNS